MKHTSGKLKSGIFAATGAAMLLGAATAARAQMPPRLFVANLANGANSVTNYKLSDNGNVAPQLHITGTSTKLYFGAALPNVEAGAVALDSRGNIYVASYGNSSVVEYSPNPADGNLAPTAEISGANTGLSGPTAIALDSTDNIYVTDYQGAVLVFAAGSHGDVSPTSKVSGTITGADGTGLSAPEGIAVDSHGNIYVTNSKTDTINIYPAGSNGQKAPNNAAECASDGPNATICGSKAELHTPKGIAIDANGNIYVANYGNDSVTVYAQGSHGNAAPRAIVTGDATGIGDPWGIVLDSSGNLYVANSSNSEPGLFVADSGHTDSITVYSAAQVSSGGNVAPIATISGGNTNLKAPGGIAIGPSSALGTATANAKSSSI
ncbi:MAG TPA: NHL repeat-containing protein [Candidatus Binataceae bacterium]|nr:NHL repeat-containing protein [Candidatus Binataceae bacterium]